jgi:FkbM family methyltransferase
VTDPAARGPAAELEAAWAARVGANREQAERVRESADDGDFYAPVRGMFVADPRRTDDPTLDSLLQLARPHETWLDIGAGAGRYALPLALHVREVIALDPSAGMLEALRDGMERHGVRNIRAIHARWPIDPGSTATPGAEGSPAAGIARPDAEAPPDAEATPGAKTEPAAGLAPRADVALIAHLGYDVEAIGLFLDAMEAAAGRLCVAVLADRVPAAPAWPFWPVVHGEPRVELPALEEFLAILRARGCEPSVTYGSRQPRGFASRGALLAWLRNQLFVAAGSAADQRLEAELERRADASEDGTVHLIPETASSVAVATWMPRA